MNASSCLAKTSPTSAVKNIIDKVKGKAAFSKPLPDCNALTVPSRVFNSPLAEANIVGRASRHGHSRTEACRRNSILRLHLARHDATPQRTGVDALALSRWIRIAAVIRVPIGGYLTGGAIYHSQCGETIFTHTPGLRVVMPSTALDLAGLLRTAIRCDDPVMFFEHKHLYRQPYNRSEDPGPDYTIPLGKARVTREGNDCTIITYGALVHRAEVAAAQLEREGVSVEVVDLRSLSPYDWEAIAASVTKTNRVIVAYEDTLSWGYGAEIAARIADELFGDLDAPSAA